MNLDVFNGDADGLCALHQWRLAYPDNAERISGVKRHIDLLTGVDLRAGDCLTVFDISFDSNRADALRLLEKGVLIRWFDHHYAGSIPPHRNLQASIDTSADVCTSLLVDRALGGRYRGWAVTAAFGDNLHDAARREAASLNLSGRDLDALAELGELLNYNGYGDAVADLHFPPEDLFRAIREFVNPLDFIAASPVFAELRRGFEGDIGAAVGLVPCFRQDRAVAYLLPDEAWARRVIGVFANRLAVAAPDRAHALLVPNVAGDFTVSVRAPKTRPEGADELCLGFPTGGGRKAAAGVNHLPHTELESFLRRFGIVFQ